MDLASFLRRLPAELRGAILASLSPHDYAALRACSRDMRAAVDSVGPAEFRGLEPLENLVDRWRQRSRAADQDCPPRPYYRGSRLHRRLHGTFAARARTALGLQRAPPYYQYSPERQDAADYDCRHDSEGQPISACVYQLLLDQNADLLDALCGGRTTGELAEHLRATYEGTAAAWRTRQFQWWDLWLYDHWHPRTRKFARGFTWLHVARVILYARWLREHRREFRKVRFRADPDGDCHPCFCFLHKLSHHFPGLAALSLELGCDYVNINTGFAFHNPIRGCRFELTLYDATVAPWRTPTRWPSSLKLRLLGNGAEFIGVVVHSVNREGSRGVSAEVIGGRGTFVPKCTQQTARSGAIVNSYFMVCSRQCKN